MLKTKAARKRSFRAAAAVKSAPGGSVAAYQTAVATAGRHQTRPSRTVAADDRGRMRDLGLFRHGLRLFAAGDRLLAFGGEAVRHCDMPDFGDACRRRPIFQDGLLLTVDNAHGELLVCNVRLMIYSEMNYNSLYPNLYYTLIKHFVK